MLSFEKKELCRKSRVIVSSRSMATLLAYGLLILPSVALAYYITVFGVNVVFWDEWEMVPLIRKMMSGTLSFADFFGQHNEHRIPFARAAILAIAARTGFNTTVEMAFSWVLISLTGLLIFYVYGRKSSCGSQVKALLIFLPMSLLLYSFGQYESILMGFTCHIYMMVLGAVATFCLLQVSKRIDVWFALSLAAGIVASFSFATGLMVWPAGLVQLLFSSGQRKEWRRAALWCLVGTINFALFSYGWVKPVYHPPLTYVLTNPTGTAMYFLAFVGAPFSTSSSLPIAVAFGSVTVLIVAVVMAQGYRGGLLRRNGIWVSFILFVSLSLVITTLGRAGFGVEQALASRYTPVTVIGIAGLYLLAVSISEKSSAKTRSFGAHALLALLLVGLIVSTGMGWKAGESMHYSREMGAYILKTYKIQSDENIATYLYPDPAVARERAEFLEQNKLNVFSESTMDPSTMILIPNDTLFALDTINGEAVGSFPVLVELRKEETITIKGWAVDKQANDAASAVFITIDGKTDIPTLYGLDRPDVANAYKTLNFRFSGYVATFSSSILTAGEHTISVKIVSKDGAHFYYAQQLLYLMVS